MKQKIDYKIVTLLISISILLITISGGEFVSNAMISSFYDIILYLLLFGCIIFLENIIFNKKRGVYLPNKENIVLIIVSISYLLIKITLPFIVELFFINYDVSIIVLIILRYLLLTGYINYILLINQDNHSIKQIILNELFITLIIVIILLLLSIITDIKIIFLKEVLKVVVIAAVLIGAYVLSLKKLDI